MTSNELMLGDWVQTRGEKTIVKISDHWDIENAKSFYPIPITPEILEKNGFVYLKDEHCYYYLNIDLHPMKFGKYAPYRIGKTTMFINDVHGLQHALRLAGIEKEIVL